MTKQSKKVEGRRQKTNPEADAAAFQSGGATPVRTVEPGELRIVKAADCRPSPTQPRTVFDPVKLKELGDSILAQGVQIPLLLRARPQEYTIHEPDLTHNDWIVQDSKGGENFFEFEQQARNFAGSDNLKPWFEIVDGERRWRAGLEAGLTDFPAMVRELTDEQVVQIQLISFLQKEGLTALEEAEAFRKLIDSGQHTVESLQKQTGKSRSHIWGRLALVKLSGPAREALLSDKIVTSVASAVATIPDLAKQEAFLKIITDEEHYKYPWSVRDVREEIERNYRVSLEESPFDLKDAELDATAGPCSKCPLRTGNMKELLGTDVNPNVCTSPNCYQGKVKAAEQRAVHEAESAGKTVLLADEYQKQRRQLIQLDDTVYIPGADKHPTYRELLGKHANKASTLALVPMNGELREVMSSEQAEALLEQHKLMPKVEPSQHDKEREAMEKLREKNLVVVKEGMQEILRKATTLELETEFLKKLLVLLLGKGDLDVNHLYDARPQIMEGNEDVDETEALLDYATNRMHQSEENIRGLLVHALVDAGVDWQGQPHGEFLAACRVFGVDLEEIERTLNEVKKPKGKAKPKAKVKAKAKKAVKGKGKK